MLKMLDKTNIDFIGPRYYCMAGSLILIVLGLIATAVRGTVDVQHRLHRRHAGHDPAQRERPDACRRCPSRGGPSSSAQKAERPARRDGREPAGRATTRALTRFNIRTTDQDPEHVKNEILDAFGPSLARVEMTVSEGKPIAGAPRRPAAAKTAPRRDQPVRGRPRVRAELQHDGLQQHPIARAGRLGRIRQGARSRPRSPTRRRGSRSSSAAGRHGRSRRRRRPEPR